MADRLAARGWPGWLIFCIGILCDFDTICSYPVVVEERGKREREKKNERKKGKFHILRKFQEIPIAFDGHIVRYTD